MVNIDTPHCFSITIINPSRDNNNNFRIHRRDPRGNKLKTISEKIYVKNEDHLSQLTIKDLELYDSGTYTLMAYNEAGKKEINVTLFVEGNSIDDKTRSTNPNFF